MFGAKAREDCERGVHVDLVGNVGRYRGEDRPTVQVVRHVRAKMSDARRT